MNSVFIIDDHPVIRMAVRMLLENENYTVVGETDNGVDAMQMVRECMPDLIILDISIPKLDGLEVLARFSTMGLPSKILVLTSQTPNLFAIRCMQSGASGYVCKQEDLSELLSSVKAVLSGYNYFPSQALACAVREDGMTSELELFKLVNDRELMVLQLFAQGRSNKEIAKGMFLSNKTVSTYKTRLMQKLKTRTLVELIEMAKRNALVYCLKNKCSVKSSMLAR
ncbi:response regulator transcription factor [Pseudomonas syringae pv. actinidiae]|uniref:DNA-binding response regulator n=4 Tax=Pseudomonas syringae TaxID=317 RepID=A0AAN4TM99_PSESF|nr:response regulator transcription factor [Pseudomonas syringae]EPN67770.1 LuxR response regulator receiver [Pseudomonas syringae pv. actinidiae ICMP 19101]EPN68806.1 LuxR response regulator receiver [Pseudomonas syringae pv. actinidiae ICMP 19079]AKT31326.1 LuxR family transcriptional regulator [Pseudomonas syringae pv. actinidiae ICMP 18884]AOE57715.1 LuxR family transcriptional regulator [Pseudomonas syringae pv. actinidiae ICMP 18708]APP98670.1 DNA-binding response regulator [Pseudomonas 